MMAYWKMLFVVISVNLFIPSHLTAGSKSIHLTGYKTTFILLAFQTASILTLSDHHPRSEKCEKLTKFQKCLSHSSSPASMFTTPHSNSTLYHKLNQPWNTRKRKATPIGYFLPTSTPDVQNAVRCGVLANLKLIPNSGGHSYESIGYGDDSSIIIDFREMGQISLLKEGEHPFNVSTPVAVIQTGALLGPIYAQLWTLGRVGIPIGQCLTVGIGGHVIGGGIGFFTQTFGLTLDSLLQVEMVDAGGRAVIASTTQNEELFWGIRGMGSGYIGIVTKFWMKTFRADELKLTYVRMVYQVSDFVQVVQAYQEWLKWTSVNEPGAVAWLTVFTGEVYFKKEVGVVVKLVHIFDPLRNPRSNSTFLSKMEEIFPPTPDTIIAFPGYLPFASATSDAPQRAPKKPKDQKSAQIQQNFDSKLANKWPPPFFPKVEDVIKQFNGARKEQAFPRYFYNKSLYVKRYITLEELKGLEKVLKTLPSNNFMIFMSTEGGEVGKVAKSGTSYVHRDALMNFWIVLQVFPEKEGEGAVGKGMAWLNAFWAAMQSFDGGETYQNCVDLEVKDFLKRHYGSNLGRLVELKRVWDPQNYFVNPMSIPVKLDECGV